MGNRLSSNQGPWPTFPKELPLSLLLFQADVEKHLRNTCGILAEKHKLS